MKNEKFFKQGYNILIFVIVFLYYMPYFGSQMYISSDEFSSIAVPAIFTGNNWMPTLALHSYHGLGFTILMTPLFGFITNGVIAHKIIIVCAFALKIVVAKLLFELFNKHFCCEQWEAITLSIMFTCGVFGGDEYGLSALSELPFATLLVVTVFMWFMYAKTQKKVYVVWAVLSLAFTYTIHSRCLILFIAITLTLILYMLIERKIEKRYLTILLLFVGILLIFGAATSIIQSNIYVVPEGEQLTNDPMMVLSASSYQLEKLLNLDTIYKIIKICMSLVASQCVISLGVGAVAIGACIYVIVDGLFGKKEFDRKIFYLAFVALFCVFGMNFSIGIQSVGRIDAGNYAWLTYIRYAEPFWVLPYIVFAYVVSKKLKWSMRVISIACVWAVGIFIMNYLVEVLASGNGLSYSVINRLFYSNAMGVRTYFGIFVKCMFVVSVFFVAGWNSRWKKAILIFVCAGMMVINYQYTEYYLEKEKAEYDTVDTSWKLASALKESDVEANLYADADSLVYSSKLQFLCFDETLRYLPTEYKVLGEGDIMFSNSKKIEFESEDVQVIEIDKGEYVYTSDAKMRQFIEDFMER